ncbi:MAG: hypothetical protein K2P40_10950, partial [Lachnospiraceae bacterium]|nr:hypothetical protein [Lachnospiraceae bacterium]
GVNSNPFALKISTQKKRQETEGIVRLWQHKNAGIINTISAAFPVSKTNYTLIFVPLSFSYLSPS